VPLPVLPMLPEAVTVWLWLSELVAMLLGLVLCVLLEVLQ
jgi:hypothetical protein